MDVLTNPAGMRAWRAAHPGRLGFVPTMGYLHDGHLALCQRALAENDLAVASIFVNPAQFGPNEDFERYPRDEVRDLSLLKDLGIAAVYLPAADVIYPPGFQTYVDVTGVSTGLEGERRPGHFRGVATIVLKLFAAVGPDRAYFGRKDAQQLRVIKRMTRDLDLGIEIVACDTVREPDGLAMSSRNVYLSGHQRVAATVISRALAAARAEWEAGERDAARLRGIVACLVGHEPEACIDYISLADDETLTEIEGEARAAALLSLVVRFGSTRLLDNVELRIPASG